MTKQQIEAWLSLVERCVRDAEVAGSNPVASTPWQGRRNPLFKGFRFFFCYYRYLMKISLYGLFTKKIHKNSTNTQWVKKIPGSF